jgi:hypothetical protein
MPEPQPNPNVRREPSDASLKWVLWILAAGILAAVLIHWGTWRLYGRFQERRAAERRPGHALSPGPDQPEPREPRLEQVDRMAGRAPDAVADAAAESDASRYGPGDATGYVRVPIERAMDRLLGKAPVRSAPPPDQSRRAGGLLDAGEPNSGRAFRKEER